MKPLERELATMRGFAACRGDDDCLDEADAELARLRKIEEAAELACGLLWMVEDRREKVRAAFHALRDALGGSGSKGLGKAIKRAIDAGHEADHPPGMDWWAGKKEKHYPEEWGPSDNRRLTCVCGDPDPFHATKTPNVEGNRLAAHEPKQER